MSLAERQALFRTLAESVEQFTFPTLQATDRKQDLWDLVTEFVRENDITCEDDIYRTDRAIENSHALIEAMCEIVGYAAPEA